MRANININHGDCMKAMARMQDNQYDLAVVDPPYGIGSISTGLNTVSKVYKKGFKWNDFIPTENYFNELYRISKNQIIWGCNYYGTNIKHVGRIVHDKGRDHVSRDWACKFSDCDLASQSFNNRIEKFKYQWAGNLQNGKINWGNTGLDRRIHPTQKPIALYQWLLATYAKEGDKILDTHGGSMSIALACWDLKFDLDLWELDEDYYKAGKERFENYTMQGQFDFE